MRGTREPSYRNWHSADLSQLHWHVCVCTRAYVCVRAWVHAWVCLRCLDGRWLGEMCERCKDTKADGRDYEESILQRIKTMMMRGEENKAERTLQQVASNESTTINLDKTGEAKLCLKMMRLM